jgi:hypothetical protein
VREPLFDDVLANFNADQKKWENAANFQKMPWSMQ